MSTKGASDLEKVRKTKRVPFSVANLEGKEIAITGDFTDWSEEGIRLDSGSNGAWKTVLDLEPGRYEYRLRVDGDWCDDPDCSEFAPNPYGGRNAVLRVL